MTVVAGVHGWRRYLPVTSWLPGYRRRLLAGDLLAGLVVATLAIPQSLGYAGIAGLPIIVGLYAIPLALVAYALLGSSPQLVVGPVSTVSVLTGSLVADLSAGDPTKAVAFASALAIGAGVGLLIGGVARLGWAAEFMSRPIVTGFVFGLVLLIVIGEIPSLLGIPATSGEVQERVWAILTSLPELDPTTAAIGIAALAVLFVGSRFAPRVPWALILLVGSIALSSAVDLSAQGVATVGEVPTGLPPFGLPDIGLSDLGPVVLGGLALALVGLAEGLSAARLFAARDGYSVDTDQELIATGAANIAAGMSGGMGVAGSLSKTAASRRAGGHTQLTGVATAVVVIVALVALAGLLAPLPKAVLSAIVIQAVWSLMDVRALRRYRAIRNNDISAAIAAMAGVLILGPLYGLLVAIGIAVLGLVYRSSRVETDVMGKVPGEKAAWGSITRHPERRTYDGILVLRLDVPLFWANATEIHDRVLDAVDKRPDVRAILLDLEATSQLDTTSIDMLELLMEQLNDRDVRLYLVRVFYRARVTLARAGFITLLGEDRMWHSISAGVRAARRAEGLTAKAHDQVSPLGLDDEDHEGDDDMASERIVLDHDVSAPGPDEESPLAPRGGYQDPGPAPSRRRRAEESR